MSRQALPHEVREVVDRLPGWFRSFLNWSLHVDRHGWPLLRHIPLHLACFIVTLYVRGIL